MTREQVWRRAPRPGAAPVINAFFPSTVRCEAYLNSLNAVPVQLSRGAQPQGRTAAAALHVNDRFKASNETFPCAHARQYGGALRLRKRIYKTAEMCGLFCRRPVKIQKSAAFGHWIWIALAQAPQNTPDDMTNFSKA